MRVLLASDWQGQMHAEAFSRAWTEMGVEVVEFSWKEYFVNGFSGSGESNQSSLFSRFQNKYIFGPTIFRLNKDLVSLSMRSRPDLLFVYRGTHIFPETLRKIKMVCGSKVFGYHNDDPFSKHNNRFSWRFFHGSLKEYDHIFSYRHKNLDDYSNMGHHNISLLRSSFIAERNFPEEVDYRKFLSDVVFVGHFEDDGRDQMFKQLLELGINLKIYGPEWERSAHYSFFKKRMGPILPAIDNYNMVLNSTKIAIVLFSKINKDSYTRRCFEIPATKTLMVCEYSKDMAENLFNEGQEAIYFRSFDDLAQKLKYYLANEDDRERIANNAFERLHYDGHNIGDRCKQVLSIYKNLKEKEHHV